MESESIRLNFVEIFAPPKTAIELFAFSFTFDRAVSSSSKRNPAQASSENVITPVVEAWAHASTTGVITFSDDACAGFLLDEELTALSKVKENAKSSIAVLGGAKISTKLSLIDSLSKTVDKVILGGGIANTCLAAKGYEVGKSLIEDSMLEEAKELVANPKIIIPESVIVSISADEPGRITSANSIQENEAIFDIAPASFVDLEPIIMNAGTILWNGPLGFFEKENFFAGTAMMAEMIISSKGLLKK